MGGDADFKHDIYTQFSRVGKALANPSRLELLELLAQGERSVEALGKVAGLSIANTSQHLQQMREIGLVTGHKVGQHVFYRLAGEEVVALLECVRRVAEMHVETVGSLLQARRSQDEDVEKLPAAELLSRAREGLVTVIDVRPAEEYAAGHLPGAVNIPLEELEVHLAGLPAGGEVVAYCRGPYCLLASVAVARLREKGFRARRLETGFPQWKLAGLPVEETADRR